MSKKYRNEIDLLCPQCGNESPRFTRRDGDNPKRCRFCGYEFTKNQIVREKKRDRD